MNQLFAGCRRPALLISICTAALIALGAAPAFASTASRAGSELTYTAVAGETNDVTVTLASDSYVIDDPGVAITPGANCTAVDADTVTCPAAFVLEVTLDLNDMNDVADLAAHTSARSTLNGGAGNDTLSATTGAHDFNGGANTDTVSYATRTAAVVADVDGTADDGQTGEGDNIGADVENLTGGSGADTLTGSAGANTLSGGNGGDTLSGLAGVNVLQGEGGNDTLNPGSDDSGDDTLNGGEGDQDSVSYAGRAPAVTITVGNDADSDGEALEDDKVTESVERITGGNHGDTITGDASNETFTGGTGIDSLNGGAGNDTFLEGTDKNNGDTFNGDGGTDTVDYSARTAAITVSVDGVANDGDPSLLPENDNVATTVEVVNGGSAADTLSGGAGSQTLNGNGGGDTFSEGAAANGGDTFNGGAGSDTLSYASRANALTITVGDGVANDGEGEGDNVAGDIETITGGGGGDEITGSSAGETLNGGGGMDVLSGAGGADSLNGGDASDTLRGGDGDDSLNGGASGDELNGDAGNDTLTGGDANDVLSGNAGDDRFAEGSAKSGDDLMFGGDGVDTADYSARSADITVTIDGVQNDGDRSATAESDNVTTDVEDVEGGTADDSLSGSSGANVLTGNGGDDSLSGNAGDDVFDEGTAANGGDTFDGGAGFDTVDYSARTAALTVTVGAGANDGEPGNALPLDDENDDVQASVEIVDGGSAADTLTGGTGIDTLNGNGGNDTLNGGDSPDALNGGAGDDTVNGGNGNDVLHGDDGNDTVNGDAGDDGILGDAGTDTMSGGTGADLIVARDGTVDTVNCGPDSDGVAADANDNVAADCEIVDRGTGTGTGGPTPGPGPGPGPGTEPGGDTRAPRAGVRATSRQRLSTLLRRGLGARISCSERCSIRADLVIDRRTARRLRLGRLTVVGRTRSSLTRAGAKRVTVRFGSRARSALRRATTVRSFRMTLRVRVVDRAGNDRTVSRRILVRR